MKKLLSALVVVLSIAMAHSAHAAWCHRPEGGIEQCDKVPSTWNQCGTTPNGAPIFCYPQGASKKHSKSHSNTEVVLISVGVGVAVVGLAWYFFKKKPSKNNPGQVSLVEF